MLSPGSSVMSRIHALFFCYILAGRKHNEYTSISIIRTKFPFVVGSMKEISRVRAGW